MRRPAGSAKCRNAVAGALATALLLGCASVPRYIRGDIRSEGYAPIPASASFSLLHSLVPRAIDEAIAGEIVRSLEQAGHHMAAPERADILIAYQQSDHGERHASTAFEASWVEQRSLECPERFSQRLAVIATRNDQGMPGAALWLAELCSDGGGLESSAHMDAFTRELLRSFGANRAQRRFEVLLPSIRAAPETAGEPLEDRRSAPRPSTPQTPGEPAEPVAATAAAAAPVAEFVEPGPTWSDAQDACASLARRPGVDCALVVIAASGTPVLELGYPTRSAAIEHWKHDVAEAGAIFCRTAARHGVFELAAIHIFAPDQRAQRTCRTLDQWESTEPQSAPAQDSPAQPRQR